MQRVVPGVLVCLLIASCDGLFDSFESKVARGKAVFQAECANCHGQAGGGTAYGADLRSKLQVGYSYARFSSTVMSGRQQKTPEGERKVMPRFADRPKVKKNLEAIYFYLNEQALPSKVD